MKYILFAFLTLFMFFAAKGAGIAEEGPKSPEKPTEKGQLLQVTLHPMPEPRPALKYRLLPPVVDLHAGNAAMWWYRLLPCDAEYLAEFRSPAMRKKFVQWMDIPISDPQEKELRTKEPAIDTIAERDLFKKMDYAARCGSCDWEFPAEDWLVTEGLSNDVGIWQTWSWMLAAKEHREIIGNKYDDAIHTFQTELALARHIAERRRFIDVALAGAMGRQVGEQIEKLIEKPDAPNLYWALAMLPRPFVTFRQGYEWESFNLALKAPYLRDLERKQLNKREWDRLLARLLSEFAKAKIEVSAAKIAGGVPRARKYLIDHGRASDDVAAMPDSQVILLYSLNLYQSYQDDLYKVAYMTCREAETENERLVKLQHEVFEQEIIPLAWSSTIALIQIRRREPESTFAFSYLQIYEALRMYAAAHHGELPERLEDLHATPAPNNPYDERPFNYSRRGDHATLRVDYGPRGKSWSAEIIMATAPK